jgi:hypothetical protein
MQGAASKAGGTGNYCPAPLAMDLKLIFELRATAVLAPSVLPSSCAKHVLDSGLAALIAVREAMTFGHGPLWWGHRRYGSKPHGKQSREQELRSLVISTS